MTEMRHKLKKNHKKPAVLVYALVFIFMFIICLFIFAFAIPFTMTINTALWVNGQDILALGQTYANNIDDPAVRTAVTGIFTNSTNAFVDNTQILGTFAQYGWVFVIVIVALIIIIYARRQVEVGAGVR